MALPTTCVAVQLGGELVSRQHKLRIAYVVQNPSFDLLTESPAIAITVKNVVRSLQVAGHRVDYYDLRGRCVSCIADMSAPEQRLTSKLGFSGSCAFKLFESGVRRVQRMVKGHYLALFDSLRFYDACMRALSQYDVCHEHNSVLSVGAALACKQLNIPYVITVDADPIFELKIQGVPLKGLQLALAHWEARQTYRIARCVLCLSEATRQRLITYWKVPAEKIVVLPLAADIDLFGRQYDRDEVRRSLGFGDEPVVGFVGSFQMWHGLEDLVESFVSVRRRFPNSRLLLIGDGPGRAAVEDHARRLGVYDSMTITGRVSYRDIPRYLAAMDVAAAPYPRLGYEMWFSPLKLYEYMAAGKAIVATRCGQIPEVIQEGITGLLVEPGDVSGFAQAVCRVIADPIFRRKLGINARRQAETRHSWTHLAERLEEVYCGILNAASQTQ